MITNLIILDNYNREVKNIPVQLNLHSISLLENSYIEFENVEYLFSKKKIYFNNNQEMIRIDLKFKIDSNKFK